MLTTILVTTYEKYLNRLKDEIAQYTSEEQLWKTAEGISNSGGNLCLHLMGNLNHFIGATLGNTGYVRYRDKEFSEKNAPREKLIADIENTLAMIHKTLSSLSDEDYQKVYPVSVFGYEMTTGYFLTDLTSHLAYHLGQINYHRRLVK